MNQENYDGWESPDDGAGCCGVAIAIALLATVISAAAVIAWLTGWIR